VASTPVVVADGHHRYETALTYQGEAGTPASGSMMTYVVELVDDQLTVRPIHRLLSGMPDDFDLGRALASFYDVREGAAAADGPTLVLPGDRRAVLVERPGVFDGTPALDSARLSKALRDVPVEVAFQHGADRVQKAVDSGEAQAGVLVRPATVSRIRANAASGERMPPKTTFFHPKPPTGIVFRSVSGT
jgi:uncharacterized protein (DUF1015 family)